MDSSSSGCDKIKCPVMAPVPAVRDTKGSKPKGPKVIKLVNIM